MQFRKHKQHKHKKKALLSPQLSLIKVASVPSAISCCCVLRSKNSKWAQSGPVLAVSPSPGCHGPGSESGKHNFDAMCVRLFSLSERQYVHVHRLRTRVTGIVSSRRALVLVSEKELVVLDPDSDTQLFRRAMASNPRHAPALVALGPRWLAFADYKLRKCVDCKHRDTGRDCAQRRTLVQDLLALF